jgi:hypothetical protein
VRLDRAALSEAGHQIVVSSGTGSAPTSIPANWRSVTESYNASSTAGAQNLFSQIVFFEQMAELALRSNLCYQASLTFSVVQRKAAPSGGLVFCCDCHT